jgi:hypothetical protein
MGLRMKKTKTVVLRSAPVAPKRLVYDSHMHTPLCK